MRDNLLSKAWYRYLIYFLLLLLLKSFCNAASLFYGHANKSHCCCCCYSLHATEPEICNSLIGHVARMQTSPTYACMNSSHFSRLGFTLKIQSVLGIGNRRAYNIFLVIQWKQRSIYDCATSIRLPFRQRGSIMLLDLVKCCEILFTQEPITRSLQLPHIPVTAFSPTHLFLVWIYLEFRSP